MFGFSDLEDRLLGENGEATFHSTLKAIRDIRAEAQGGIDSGLAKDDYERAELLMAACNAAEQIVLDTSHLKGAKSK